MSARQIEDRRRSEERRWRRVEGPVPKRHGRSFSEVRARREYLALHQQLELSVTEEVADEVMRLAVRIRSSHVRREEKKRVLLMLAHHRGPLAEEALARFAASPERGLESFAQLALEEARRIASLGGCGLARQAPCLCESGRKLKDCCGSAL